MTPNRSPNLSPSCRPERSRSGRARGLWRGGASNGQTAPCPPWCPRRRCLRPLCLRHRLQPPAPARRRIQRRRPEYRLKSRSDRCCWWAFAAWPSMSGIPSLPIFAIGIWVGWCFLTSMRRVGLTCVTSSRRSRYARWWLAFSRSRLMPLLVAVDQEGGKVARLDERHGFPPTVSHRFLGEQDNLALTREAATALGQNLGRGRHHAQPGAGGRC